MSELRPAIVVFLLLTIVTGLVYPAIITLAAQGLFPSQAAGSVIVDSAGRIRGSTLVGQPFDAPQYFWGRLSATGPFPYNAAASSGSNLGPLNPALADVAKTRIAALQAGGAHESCPVPIDLVTASGSGLDPEISLTAADYQASRVAQARELAEDAVRRLISEHTSPRTLGLFGEPRVNVLRLNLAADAFQQQQHGPASQ